MTEKDRMLAGRLYRADDAELLAGDARARRLARKYNATTEEEIDLRRQLLCELLGSAARAPILSLLFTAITVRTSM